MLPPPPASHLAELDWISSLDELIIINENSIVVSHWYFL
jgi:hypothetical protein